MRSKLSKWFLGIVAAAFAASFATAFAGTIDTGAYQDKPDCKKDATDPRCKDEKKKEQQQ